VRERERLRAAVQRGVRAQVRCARARARAVSPRRPSHPTRATPHPQLALLGYEFPDTVALLAGGTLFVHATQKKLDYLRDAAAASADGPLKVVLLPREKGDAAVPANRAALDALLGAIASSGGRLGHFPSDAHEGPVAAAWEDELKKAAVERVDATAGLEAFFAVKDAAAVEDIKAAGIFTARILKSVMVREMESVIDEGKAVSHAAFSEGLAEIIDSRDALV
jgi:nucleosome binding factor SPN SPT16 subunit